MAECVPAYIAVVIIMLTFTMAIATSSEFQYFIEVEECVTNIVA